MFVKFAKTSILEGYKLYHIWSGKKPVHFLHISKTGGSAIRSAFSKKSPVSGNISPQPGRLFLMHGHNFTLSEVKNNEQAFFVVRCPLKRYVSGFYSRMREGKPKNHNPWTEEESIAFSKFKTPNELGEAIDSKDNKKRESAHFAMKNIGHVNTSYWDWLESSSYFMENKHKILCVLNQNSLNDDFNIFCEKYNININRLPKNNIQSHKTPEKYSKFLSERSVKNLKNWYSKEYEFIHTLINADLITENFLDEIM